MTRLLPSFSNAQFILFGFFMVVLDLAKGLSEQIPNKKPLPYCYANFFEKNLGPGRIYALVYIPHAVMLGELFSCNKSTIHYRSTGMVWKVRNKFKGRHTLYVCLLDNNAVYGLLRCDKKILQKMSAGTNTCSVFQVHTHTHTQCRDVIIITQMRKCRV